MKTNELQSRLNAKADAKLHDEIRQIKNAIRKPLQTGWGSIKITIEAKTESVTIDLVDLIDGLSGSLLEHLKERWRKQETDDFIHQVESLGSQIDELRDDAGLS